jgi:hypothetical protein
MSQRIALRACGCAAIAFALLAARQAPSPYTHAATVDAIIDGQQLRTFSFDAVANRLYAGSDRGLFWLDFADAELRMKGPMVRKDISVVEAAPGLDRVFFMTDDEIGYVDTRAPGTAVHLAPRDRGLDIAYEPTRRELYVGTFAPRIRVFDAASGERAPDIELPGWYAQNLDGMPGRVLLTLPSAQGIYAIEAGTRKAERWKLSRPFVTPAYIETDPMGRYVFLTNSRYLAVVDAKSGAVLGQRATPTPAAIAFDPESSQLIAAWFDDPPPLRLVVFRVDESGLTQIAELENPVRGRRGMESVRGGFIQDGIRSLLVWKAPSRQ